MKHIVNFTITPEHGKAEKDKWLKSLAENCVFYSFDNEKYYCAKHGENCEKLKQLEKA